MQTGTKIEFLGLYLLLIPQLLRTTQTTVYTDTQVLDHIQCETLSEEQYVSNMGELCFNYRYSM